MKFCRCKFSHLPFLCTLRIKAELFKFDWSSKSMEKSAYDRTVFENL